MLSHPTHDAAMGNAMWISPHASALPGRRRVPWPPPVRTGAPPSHLEGGVYEGAQFRSFMAANGLEEGAGPPLHRRSMALALRRQLSNPATRWCMSQCRTVKWAAAAGTSWPYRKCKQGIAYRRRFAVGYTADYYKRDCLEAQSWKMGIIRPQDMGAAVCYALGATSWDEVCRTLGIADDGTDTRTLPSSTRAVDQAEALRTGATRTPHLVFDIGCGRGEVAATLAYLGIDAVAVDPSRHAGDFVAQTPPKLYGLKSDAVKFMSATAYEALSRHTRVPDTLVFCESIEHIPVKEVDRTVEWIASHAGEHAAGIRVIITNWPYFHPIRAVPGDWDHVHDVDDDFYDRLASAAKSTIVRHGSHLVLDF